MIKIGKLSKMIRICWLAFETFPNEIDWPSLSSQILIYNHPTDPDLPSLYIDDYRPLLLQRVLAPDRILGSV